MLFYASRPHFIDHLLPVFDELQGEAVFCVPPNLENYARSKGVKIVPTIFNGRKNEPPADGKVAVVCSTGDAKSCWLSNAYRDLIMFEHGVGITHAKNESYAGNKGIRQRVKLFLAPNDHILEKTHQALPLAFNVTVGTPKMDKWLGYQRPNSQRPVVCISFHWNGAGVAPEAGTALDHYKKVLEPLRIELEQYEIQLVGHGHSRIMDQLIPIYNEAGIAIWHDFDKVLEKASLYINDCSSTMYEAAMLMPVIILNAPWFNRSLNNGIRFWDWTDIGPQCNEPEDLIHTVVKTVRNNLHFDDPYRIAREKMVRALYPYWGVSSKRAAHIIREYNHAIIKE